MLYPVYLKFNYGTLHYFPTNWIVDCFEGNKWLMYSSKVRFVFHCLPCTPHLTGMTFCDLCNSNASICYAQMSAWCPNVIRNNTNNYVNIKEYVLETVTYTMWVPRYCATERCVECVAVLPRIQEFPFSYIYIYTHLNFGCDDIPHGIPQCLCESACIRLTARSYSSTALSDCFLLIILSFYARTYIRLAADSG